MPSSVTINMQTCHAWQIVQLHTKRSYTGQDTVMKMLLFTQRHVSVLWLCKCNSDTHENIIVKQSDGRAYKTSKLNMFIDIFHSFSGASSMT